MYRKIVFILIAFLFLVSCSHKPLTYRTITSEKAKEEFKSEKDYLIVDVRTKEEYDALHIKDAINIPLDTIGNEEIPELISLDQKIYLYCRSGRRSTEAALKLIEIGYKDITDFGGIVDWDGETESEE